MKGVPACTSSPNVRDSLKSYNCSQERIWASIEIGPNTVRKDCTKLSSRNFHVNVDLAFITACFGRDPSRRDGVGARAPLVSTEPALVVR